jgi:hypothetical protein
VTTRRTAGEPHDRLTRLADAMITALEANPDYEDGIKAMIFVDHGNRGGIGMHGWDDDADAVAHLFGHLAAIFEANGQKLMVVPIGGPS